MSQLLRVTLCKYNYGLLADFICISNSSVAERSRVIGLSERLLTWAGLRLFPNFHKSQRQNRTPWMSLIKWVHQHFNNYRNLCLQKLAGSYLLKLTVYFAWSAIKSDKEIKLIHSLTSCLLRKSCRNNAKSICDFETRRFFFCLLFCNINSNNKTSFV